MRILLIILVLLAACASPEEEPEEGLELAPSLRPSETVLPFVVGEPTDQFLGRNNPTQAALAAEGELAEDPTIEALPTSQTVPVQIFASDSQLLMLNYYGGINDSAPVIFLFHGEDETRSSWDAFASQLQTRGYHVLVPDIRGFGATGGTIDWELAVQDVQTMVNNLSILGRTAPGSPIGMVGVGQGANLALVGCSNEPLCQSVVAVSPSDGVLDVDSAVRNLSNRTMLLVSADDDAGSSSTADRLNSRHTGEHVWQRFGSGGRGGELFGSQPGLTTQVVEWLLRNVELPAT
jgi:pimeloyl-ACP methyl ester carboxylesterase